MIEPGYFFGEIDFVFGKQEPEGGDLIDKDLQNWPSSRQWKQEQGAQTVQSSFRRAFTVMATETCELLTLNKTDLARAEAEFEDIIAEMFSHCHKKIKRVLRIKDDFESLFIRRKVNMGETGLRSLDS